MCATAGLPESESESHCRASRQWYGSDGQEAVFVHG